MEAHREAHSDNAIRQGWIEILGEIFPEREGYTVNATIHEYRGSEPHDRDDTDDDNVVVYDRLAIYSSEYHGEIFSMVMDCVDESDAGAPQTFSRVADAVISARSKLLLKEWPKTLLPVPTYGGVIGLNDVFVYGFRPYCVEPWCDLDLVCDDPQHSKSEQYGQLSIMVLDPDLVAEEYRVDDAQLFTDWLEEWKASLVSKGLAQSLSSMSLTQASGQSPEVSEICCPEPENLSLPETFPETWKVDEFTCPAPEDMALAEPWIHTPGGALQEADEFRLPEAMKRRIECRLPSHLLETLEGIPVCGEDHISTGPVSPIDEDDTDASD